MQARDESTGSGMSDIELRDQVLTLMLAGHEVRKGPWQQSGRGGGGGARHALPWQQGVGLGMPALPWQQGCGAMCALPRRQGCGAWCALPWQQGCGLGVLYYGNKGVGLGIHYHELCWKSLNPKSRSKVSATQVVPSSRLYAITLFWSVLTLHADDCRGSGMATSSPVTASRHPVQSTGWNPDSLSRKGHRDHMGETGPAGLL